MPKQSVSIKLGDKTRHLRYDFNALVALEETLGSPISEIGTLVSGSVRLKDLRAIVWAGLLHEDSGVTENDVGNWLDLSMLGEVADKIRQAFEAALPTSDEAKNEKSPQN